jgi:hypothetical protein
MEKAYSKDGEYWEIDWDTFLDILMDRIGAEDEQGLIGAEYYEGDQVPVTTGELVDIDAVLDIIGETAWDVIGEYADDYPKFTDEEKAELKKLIVGFLDKKGRPDYFHVENAVKKTITAEDLISGGSLGGAQ